LLYCRLLDVLDTYKPWVRHCTAYMLANVLHVVLPVLQAVGCAGHVQAMGSSLYCLHAGPVMYCMSYCLYRRLLDVLDTYKPVVWEYSRLNITNTCQA
jgi:hypothetical protein